MVKPWHFFFRRLNPLKYIEEQPKKKLNMYRVKSKTEISFWKQLWSYFTCSLRCLICGMYTRACRLLFTAWLMNSPCGFPNIGTLKLVHKLIVENLFFYFDSACLETPWVFNECCCFMAVTPTHRVPLMDQFAFQKQCSFVVFQFFFSLNYGWLLIIGETLTLFFWANEWTTKRLNPLKRP